MSHWYWAEGKIKNIDKCSLHFGDVILQNTSQSPLKTLKKIKFLSSNWRFFSQIFVLLYCTLHGRSPAMTRWQNPSFQGLPTREGAQEEREMLASSAWWHAIYSNNLAATTTPSSPESSPISAQLFSTSRTRAADHLEGCRQRQWWSNWTKLSPRLWLSSWRWGKQMTMMIIIFMMTTLYYDLVAGAIFLKGWREYSSKGDTRDNRWG